MSRMNGAGWGSVLVVLASLVAPVPAWSQSEDKQAEEKSQVLDDLALATQLTAFGRGELGEATGLKEVKSPEALVAAGGILLRIHKRTGGKLPALKAEITDDDGKAVAAEEQTTTLADDAEALFDEARGMAGDKGAAIEAAIKQASLVPERGAVGGPRSISRRVGSGKTHTVKIEMVSGQFAKVHMQGTGVTQFEVLGQNGKVLWHSKGNWGFYHWTPVGRDSRIITVKVINRGGPPVNYTIHTN